MPPEPDADARALFVEELWKHPEARLAIQAAAKRINPGTPTPELDAVRFSTQMADELARTKTAREALERENQRIALDRDRNAAIIKHGLEPADVPAIEALMADADHPIASHDRAAEIIAQRRALSSIAAPRSGPSAMQIPGVQTPSNTFFTSSPSGPGIADHPRGPMGWATERAHEHLAEIWKSNPGLRPAGVH